MQQEPTENHLHDTVPLRIDTFGVSMLHNAKWTIDLPLLIPILYYCYKRPDLFPRRYPIYQVMVLFVELIYLVHALSA